MKCLRCQIETDMDQCPYCEARGSLTMTVILIILIPIALAVWALGLSKVIEYVL